MKLDGWSPANVRAVLFDAVGTLIFPEPRVASAYAAAARQCGVVLPELEVEARFQVALLLQSQADAAARDQGTSEEREKDRWRWIVGHVFHEISPSENIFRLLWTHFAHPANWRLHDDVAECWRALAGRGLRLGVASNFDDRLIGIWRELNPLNQATDVFVSSQVGWRKPSRDFFRNVEVRLGLAGTQILLVGDERGNDYQAACDAGWQTILIDRADRSAELRRIRSLLELPDVLAT